MMQREVAFEFYDARGYNTFVVACPDAPTLTASGQAIKAAADVRSNYQLYLEEAGSTPDRQIGDGTAVAFPEGRRLRFFSTPPICGG